MSALSKVRNRLGQCRTGMFKLRDEFKSREYRRALDRIIADLEGLMDFADEHFDDKRANASKRKWRDVTED